MTELSEKPDLWRCQCRDGCCCAASPGPVVWEVARHGVPERLRVCTRCRLSRDSECERIGDVERLAEFVAYDRDGAMAAFPEAFSVFDLALAGLSMIKEIRAKLQDDEESVALCRRCGEPCSTFGARRDDFVCRDCVLALYGERG